MSDDEYDDLDCAKVREVLALLGYPNPTDEHVRLVVAESKRCEPLSDDDDSQVVDRRQGISLPATTKLPAATAPAPEPPCDVIPPPPPPPPPREVESASTDGSLSVSRDDGFDSRPRLDRYGAGMRRESETAPHQTSTRRKRSSKQAENQQQLKGVHNGTPQRSQRKSVASASQQSSAATAKRITSDDPYFRRTIELPHQQHFEPYVRLIEKQERVEAKLKSRIPVDNRGAYDGGVAQAERSDMRRGPSAPDGDGNRPSTQSRTTPRKGLEGRCSSVLYDLTQDPKYKPRILTPAGPSVKQRRHCDPVARGQRMRELWGQDSFLTQQGRKEERWNVRQSMLSWGL